MRAYRRSPAEDEEGKAIAIKAAEGAYVEGDRVRTSWVATFAFQVLIYNSTIHLSH